MIIKNWIKIDTEKSRKRQMHWRFKKEVEREEGGRERRPKSN